MDNIFITKILGQKSMISAEQAVNIYHLLIQTILLNIPGDIVELGCQVGTTAVILQKTLDQYKSAKILHVYDSFEGLPDKVEQDGQTVFSKGWGSTTVDTLQKVFAYFNTKEPVIHKGWFENTLNTQLPSNIAFAHLDGDFYTSIKTSLEYVYPKLSKGAVCVIDDYWDENDQETIFEFYKNRSSYLKVKTLNNYKLPGVKKACDEFFQDKPEKVSTLIAGLDPHGYFRKE